MLKLFGSIFLLSGMVGILYSWVSEQQVRQKKIVGFIVFLQKSSYAMEKEKIRVIDYFRKYAKESCTTKEDDTLKLVLIEIANRLSKNIYPNGKKVWEEVFGEMEKEWNIDKGSFRILVQAGEGFFGKNREENRSFIEKSQKELENQYEGNNLKNIQERKVWLPVGMLGSLMVIILLI